MIVEVDGVRLEVPDDATPDEIAALAPPPTSKGESLARGVVQGATLGFADELAGYSPVAVSPITGMPIGRPSKRWQEDPKAAGQEAVAATRAEEEAARASNPKTFVAGQVLGSLPSFMASAPAAATKGALARLAPVAGQGMLQGAGYSTNAGYGLLGDIALGGAGGLLGHGAGQALGGLARGVAGFANRKLGQALAKATAEEAGKRAAAVQSAAGSLGGARAEANRVVEAIRGLLTEKNLSAEQRLALQQLQGTPEYAEAVRTLVGSLQSRLPEVAGKVSQAEAGVAAANALPSVPKLAAERVGSKAARSQVMARVKRYAPPTVGSLVGAAIGGPIGVGIGALAGAGTRPAIHALRRMVQDPAVQTQLMTPLRNAAVAAESPQVIALRQALARAAGIAAMPNMSPVEEP